MDGETPDTVPVYHNNAADHEDGKYESLVRLHKRHGHILKMLTKAHILTDKQHSVMKQLYNSSIERNNFILALVFYIHAFGFED